jgi:hypothetical protein
MRIAAIVVLMMGSAARVGAQAHEGCPMAAREHRAEVDQRHEAATSVPSGGSQHQFLLANDGGSIRLEVKDDVQTETREAIRAHLKIIARSFAAGDFSMPKRIHDQVPPGVETMKARQGVIRYTYSDTPHGGLVTISTADPEALTAVHQFLRFQIRDHGTGDAAR